jgi:hypothetical protein
VSIEVFKLSPRGEQALAWLDRARYLLACGTEVFVELDTVVAILRIENGELGEGEVPLEHLPDELE